MKGQGRSAAAGTHATADQVALYVLDALDAGERRRFERHVMACAACGEALAAEAAAELELQAAWPAIDRPLAPVINLPGVRREIDVPPAPAAVVPPVRAQPVTGAARGSSWNGLAAAAMTFLFLGYWTNGGRVLGPRDPMNDLAQVDPCGPTAICASLLPAPAPAGGAPWACSAEDAPQAMCTSVAPESGLCRAPLMCAAPE
jgi:hypothetical protein